MEIFEIVLLVAGGIIFTLSFIIPVKKEKILENVKELARDQIKELVSAEMQNTKVNISDMLDETINDAVEKAERSLERLSNEKIMAVNEYSDTVLQEINRNHTEVMFLYDMLIDKHKQVVNTAKEVQKTVKKAEDTIPRADENAAAEGKEVIPDTAPELTVPDISFISELQEKTTNSNEKILGLHNAGKSNIAIAQELGLGVGEVKLVIDLFEGM